MGLKNKIDIDDKKDFIDVAPDSKNQVMNAPKKVREKSVLISTGFDRQLLTRIDEEANAMGISRGAFIRMACNKILKEG